MASSKQRGDEDPERTVSANYRVPSGFNGRLRKLRGHLMAASGEDVPVGTLLDELVRARLALYEVIADGKAGGR
ncbi:MAG: hypothetical protein KIT14_22675 [bacterium]|nr:hypothetical protein [bacterium]